MKTAHSLLFSILIYSCILLLTSCEKEPKVYKNLSGDWKIDYDFTTINEQVDADMTLTQNGTDLSGKIDDGKDVFTLLQSCCLNGYSVTIKYYAAGNLINQTGTVNGDFNKMDGTFTVKGIYAGKWEAERD
ncbi:MAG: hypothetical protein V2I62_13905 [Bacteroidales bacterium]|jgi:hypothetical protein|nr:hypothetical protein [Bacteroidales bacterium]